MNKWLSILGTLTVIAALVGIGAFGWFSDTETSNTNTFTAGSLNLTLDGSDGTNVVKWVVGPMVPGNQPKGTFTLANTGTVAGYLDLENIVVTNQENDLIEPEASSGDVTSSVGELQDVLNLRLFVDLGCDGWISTGDVVFFNGKVGTIASNYEQNVLIPAGGTACITGIYDWWSTPDDNKAMTDSFELDLTFELGQTTGQ